MLTFFRQIRRSLIKSSSVRRYIFYALGEILLVMIGILLALQVNNWNNQRIDRKKEEKVLIQLKEEFENNNEQFQRIQRLHGLVFKAVDLLFEYIEERSIQKIGTDSLSHALGWVSTTKTATYNPSESALNSLITSGQINIIKNDTLKNALIKWKELISDYQEEELHFDDFKANHLVPFISQNANVYHKGLTMYGDPNTSLWDSDYFKSLLGVVSHFRYFILPGPESSMEAARIYTSLEEIKSMIDRELMNRFGHE